MSNHRPALRVLIIALFLLGGGGTTSLASAQAEPVVSQAAVRVVGSVRWPPDPCTSVSGDVVTLSGKLLVHTQVSVPGAIAPWTIRVGTTLTDANGAGLTGMRYQATGAVELLQAQAPTVPFLMAFQGVFDLVPPGVCSRGAVRVIGSLRFNPDGTLNLARCTESMVCTHLGFETVPIE